MIEASDTLFLIEHHDCIFHLSVNRLDDDTYLNDCYDAMKLVIQGWDANTTGRNHALLRSAFIDLSIDINDPWIQEIQSQMPKYSSIYAMKPNIDIPNEDVREAAQELYAIMMEHNNYPPDFVDKVRRLAAGEPFKTPPE